MHLNTKNSKISTVKDFQCRVKKMYNDCENGLKNKDIKRTILNCVKKNVWCKNVWYMIWPSQN